MKQILKKRGLVLKSKDYKENSKIITVLTNNGLVDLIVKGTTKINSGTKKFTLAPIDIDYLYTKSNSIAMLTEGYINNNYNNIKLNNYKNLIAMAVIEKVITFSDNIDNKELLYEFVIKILDFLDKYAYDEVVLNLFEIKLLYLIGISPVMTKCVKCGSTDELMLSIDLGGVCCRTCASFNKIDLTKEETEIFKYLYYIKIEKIDEDFLKTIDNLKIHFSKVIDLYYQKYIDFYSKVKKIIVKVS